MLTRQKKVLEETKPAEEQHEGRYGAIGGVDRFGKGVHSAGLAVGQEAIGGTGALPGNCGAGGGDEAGKQG